MSGTSNQGPTRRMRAGFPLASLALLVTVLACLLACADLDRWREHYVWLAEDWPWRLVAIFGGACLIGGLIGCTYLFVRGFRWRTRLVGAPGSMWQVIFAIGVLLAGTIVIRLGAE
jgi:uncharacterized integral membrane protein